MNPFYAQNPRFSSDGVTDSVNTGSFQAGLEEFKSYLEGLSGKESSFDAAHLNKIIASFAPALCGHLSSEIEDLLALSKYGTKLPIEDLWGKEGKHAVVSPKPRNVNIFLADYSRRR